MRRIEPLGFHQERATALLSAALSGTPNKHSDSREFALAQLRTQPGIFLIRGDWGRAAAYASAAHHAGISTPKKVIESIALQTVCEFMASDDFGRVMSPETNPDEVILALGDKTPGIKAGYFRQFINDDKTGPAFIASTLTEQCLGSSDPEIKAFLLPQNESVRTESDQPVFIALRSNLHGPGICGCCMGGFPGDPRNSEPVPLNRIPIKLS